ncbi:MAG: 50S ribosomal protein L15 [Anaerolineaceae bacterium]|jgi:large subunit ribosomal protein L15|nr:50S ribosomal protein L15 [Anaerolineaceae bacterium]MDD4043743.1 50S ribosomal protein L15 [Anaerolineaceae bacterium]MDD4578497.1 50S ribosomal protein L15 [Anaerolineaceae bacterium]
MQLHDLKPNEGSKRDRKRVGRGMRSGHGKTSGRGTKGQNARTSGGVRLYHAGGNLPFYRKLPFLRGEGFTPRNRVRYAEVNLDSLQGFKAGSEVNPETLRESGLLKKGKNLPIKIMGRGDVKVALKVKAHKVTEGARQKIEDAGGSIETIEIS